LRVARSADLLVGEDQLTWIWELAVPIIECDRGSNFAGVWWWLSAIAADAEDSGGECVARIVRETYR